MKAKKEKLTQLKTDVFLFADGWPQDVYIGSLTNLPRAGDKLELTDSFYSKNQNLLDYGSSCYYEWIVQHIIHFISDKTQTIIIEIKPF